MSSLHWTDTVGKARIPNSNPVKTVFVRNYNVDFLQIKLNGFYCDSGSFRPHLKTP